MSYPLVVVDAPEELVEVTSVLLKRELLPVVTKALAASFSELLSLCMLVIVLAVSSELVESVALFFA